MGGSGRDLLESRTSLGDPGYLPDELFAQAAAAITVTWVQSPTCARAKAMERKKRNRQRVIAKDLVVGLVTYKRGVSRDQRITPPLSFFWLR